MSARRMDLSKATAFGGRGSRFGGSGFESPESNAQSQGEWVLMARGWESKSVEAQQEAAANRPSAVTTVSEREVARRAERATLALARVRAQADLQHACAAVHRAMLEQAIRSEEHTSELQSLRHLVC